MAHFRFMDLKIWKVSIALIGKLIELADAFGDTKGFRVAEQLRSASLSILSNITECSSSFSDKDFTNFPNISRRSVFEVANISVVEFQRKYIIKEQMKQILDDLDTLSRKITNFRKSILNINR
jgi:four helix bundle protein